MEYCVYNWHQIWWMYECLLHVWPYLCNSRVSSSHLTRAVGLLLMGNFNIRGPLVQESIGGVKATVSYASLSLKVLTYSITIIIVTHAGLLCGWSYHIRQSDSTYPSHHTTLSCLACFYLHGSHACKFLHDSRFISVVSAFSIRHVYCLIL